MSRRGSKPEVQIVNLREARGFAISSIDTFLEQQRQETKPISSPTTPIPDDQTDTIISLKREKARLQEELENERHHNESLKLTLTQSLSRTTSHQIEILMKLRELMRPARKQPSIQQALQIVGDLDELQQQSSFESPKFSELNQKVQESQKLVSQLRQEGVNLKKQLKAKTRERDDLQSQLEDLNNQIEALKNSKAKIDQNFKTMKAKYQKRNEIWKTKVADLEAELEKR